jgi:hypothetical protein
MDINHDDMGPFTSISWSPSSSIALNVSCVDHLRDCAHRQLFLWDPIQIIQPQEVQIDAQFPIFFLFFMTNIIRDT